MEALENYISDIQKACNAYNVKTLFAFGSVVSDNLKPDSDIDFVVDIDNADPLVYTDNYFALKFQLEKILKRQIDLLEDKAIKNPFLKQEINNTKVLVYGE